MWRGRREAVSILFIFPSSGPSAAICGKHLSRHSGPGHTALGNYMVFLASLRRPIGPHSKGQSIPVEFISFYCLPSVGKPGGTSLVETHLEQCKARVLAGVIFGPAFVLVQALHWICLIVIPLRNGELSTVVNCHGSRPEDSFRCFSGRRKKRWLL